MNHHKKIVNEDYLHYTFKIGITSFCYISTVHDTICIYITLSFSLFHRLVNNILHQP